VIGGIRSIKVTGVGSLFVDTVKSNGGERDNGSARAIGGLYAERRNIPILNRRR
jgi:hypothetical protein